VRTERIDPTVASQQVEHHPHPLRKPFRATYADSVKGLAPQRLHVREQSDEPARLQILLNGECGEHRRGDAGQRELADRFAVVDTNAFWRIRRCAQPAPGRALI